MTGKKGGTLLSPGPSGFTLLEWMVATAIGSVVLTTAATLGARGLMAWQRADDHLQQLFRIEKWQNTLGAELRNAVALADLPFSGSAEECSFASATDSTHLVEVRYRLQVQLDGTQSLIRESRDFPIPEGEPSLTRTLLQRVRSFSFQYGTLHEEQGQPFVRWSDHWIPPQQQTQSVPMLVRVHLEAVGSQGSVQSVAMEFQIPHGTFGEAPGE